MTALDARWPYHTDEWDRMRRVALRADGLRCTCCGADTPLEVHHLQPVYADGAPFALANLASVCRRCHGAVHRELDGSLSDGDRRSWWACEAAFRRARGCQSAQLRRGQLRLPFDLLADPVPPARDRRYFPPGRRR